MKLYLPVIILMIFVFPNIMSAQKSKVIKQNKAFTIYADGVTQGDFTATAISATELTSNYQSRQNTSVSSKINFKFSINGKDNEMNAGMNHQFNLVGDVSETPLIQFGKQLKFTNEKEHFISQNRKFTIKLDLREVLAEINSKGFYTTFKGDKIYKDDFKHVYVAGETAPMFWDFDNLHTRPELEMKDPDGNGIYETVLILNAVKDQKTTAGSWSQTKDLSKFPKYKSDYLISDAIYNLSLEEMINAVEPDSTFRTGKEWAGVWTRDISYSIILSMAHLQPKVAMNSLMRKVNASKRIIQDTGTGGAYPCSTDRMVWAVAAWEVYKATGDSDWLQNSFEIIKNSIEDDYVVAYDYKTGLVRGESSFLDWREQTYPRWMQPADIFESENLATNAVHFQANIVLAQMANLLNQKTVAEKHFAYAEKIKIGINTYLWMPEKGFYAQYLYGRNFKIISPRAEALGEALCILFGIADEERSKSIIEKTPITEFGITCIFPQIPGLPPYHNDAIWPFVQSYWMMASAKTGNELAVSESIAAIYRPAALFLTNKENFVADTGDFAGTVINSSNMLWSLSGNIGLVQKVVFGIDFGVDRLTFHPFVPKSVAGERTLNNFKYREAVLDIKMQGFGNIIQTFKLDGKLAKAEILADLKGMHQIEIILAGKFSGISEVNKQANYFAPDTPIVTLKANMLSWYKIDKAISYRIIFNGKNIGITDKTNYTVLPKKSGEYQILSIDKNGVESFASEPLQIFKEDEIITYEIEKFIKKADFDYKGFSGDGFSETSKTVHNSFEIPVDIVLEGTYAVDFRYSNGNGPTNTENKCAIRSLKEKDEFLGTYVFPQRGVEEWSNWGFSNTLKVKLTKGKHTFSLVLDKPNENMNGAINQAMLDYLRLIKID